MIHKAVINHHRATCECGNMPGIWRGFEEPIGKFTTRSYAAWERHAAETPADVAGTLFDFRPPEKPKPMAETAELFA